MTRPGRPAEGGTEPPTETFVDALNVIGSRPDGWWRDRPAAVRALADRLAALVAATGEPVTLVVDGEPLEGLAEGAGAVEGFRVVYAGDQRPDAADDRIVELVTEAPDRSRVTVVSADASLRGRVNALGAAVRGPASLLTRLDALGAAH